MRVPVTLLFLAWVNFATSSSPSERNRDDTRFVWVRDRSVGGIGNDGPTETELEEGESVTIRESLLDPSDKSTIAQPSSSMPEPSHQRVHAQTINPPTTTEEGEINSVAIREWLSHTTPVASSQSPDDVIAIANSVSAPWRDAVLAGLPAALAYDWRFLINVAAKFKTASRGDNADKTSLKYLLNRISNKPLKPNSAIDNLKIDNQSKSKMKDNIHDPFLWAWKRVSPSQ